MHPELAAAFQQMLLNFSLRLEGLAGPWGPWLHFLAQPQAPSATLDK